MDAEHYAVYGVIIGTGLDVVVATAKGLVWEYGGTVMKYMAIAMVCLVLTGCGTLNMRHSRAPTPKGMVLIPAGTNSGTNPLAAGESYYSIVYPSNYSLTVSSFYMDKYEVTKAHWDKVYSWAITHGYTFDHAGSGKAAKHPVQMVNWYDVVKWCNAHSEKEGRPVSYRVGGSVYRTGQSNAVTCATNVAGYRLPTVVEWEYAARGGVSSRRFSWGDSDNIQRVRANYYSDSSSSYDTSPTRGYHPTYTNGVMPYTSPVGSFAPNSYGLYDMTGNVLEWCYDWYPGHEGSCRVHRGGAWYSGVDYCRVSFRDYSYPGDAEFAIGFRVVLPSGQ